MHQDLAGLQELLRRAARCAATSDGESALPERLRGNHASRSARPPVAMATAAADLRQLDERSLSRVGARRVHPACLRCHGGGPLARLSGLDEAGETPRGVGCAVAVALERLAGCLSRERALYVARNRPREGASGGAVPLGGAADRTDPSPTAGSYRLGDRGWRERSWASSHSAGV